MQYYYLKKAQQLYNKTIEDDKNLDQKVQTFHNLFESIFNGIETPLYISNHVNLDLDETFLKDFENEARNAVLKVNYKAGTEQFYDQVDLEYNKRFDRLIMYKYVLCFFTFTQSLLNHVYYKQREIISEDKTCEKMLILENIFLCNCHTTEDLIYLISLALRVTIEKSQIIAELSKNSHLQYKAIGIKSSIQRKNILQYF
jgi:hypothetical protein